jgi:hypothetical protein
MVSARELADLLGVKVGWVYERADRLGVVRLPGKRGRLRFELETVRAALENGLAPASASPARMSSQASNRPLQSRGRGVPTPASGRPRPKPRPVRAPRGPR